MWIFSNKNPQNDKISDHIKETQLIAYLQLNSLLFLRHLAREVSTSKYKIHFTIENFKLHTYRANLVKHLRRNDV